MQLVFLMIIAVFGMVFPCESDAIPAESVISELTQPDGTVFQARFKGDEWNNWFETIGGYSVKEGKDGHWYYISRYDADTPILSGILAHETPPIGLVKHLRPQPSVMRAERTRDALSGALEAAPLGEFSGPILFILAEFSDTSGTYTEADFASSINKISDYYNKASYGKVSLSPANEWFGTANNGVVGWVNVGETHPNTGRDTGDVNRQITADAITAADEYVDFSAYDTSGNGLVSETELAVVVVVAGYDRAYGDYSPSVWGHKGTFTSYAPSVDGVTIGGYFGGYAQFGEVHQSIFDPAHQATMGVMVHELGHLIFDLPDLYDSDGSSSGIGAFGVMGAGSHGRASSDIYTGETPVLPCAWTKYSLGWVTAPSESGNLSIVAAGVTTTGSSTVYRLRTKFIHEYFLIENRQPLGYDRGLERWLGTGFGGLAIWHLDEDVIAANDPTPNDNECYPPSDCTNNHYGVALVQADNNWDLEKDINRGNATDLWYLSNGEEFNDTSNPSSKLWDGTASYVSLIDISASASIMTAFVPQRKLHVDGQVATSGSGASWVAPLKTIQEAIDAAHDRDQIWVKAGEYRPGSVIIFDGDVHTEKIYIYGGFNGTESQLEERDWQANVTTVNGQNSVTCFKAAGSSNVTIDGFSIINGMQAITIFDSNVTIRNCTISGNHDLGFYKGGAMIVYGGSVLVENSTFSGNTAKTEIGYGGSGGAIYLDGADVTIRNCTFSANESGFYGGAIHNEYGILEITNSRFFGNSSLYGGGIINRYGQATIEGSIFSGNLSTGTTSGAGGAIYNWNSSPDIINCTFSGNHAHIGGAIDNNDSNPTIINSILWGDTADLGGPEIYDDSTSSATVRYSNINQLGYAGSDGNIREDPLFVGGGNFHLQPGSLCIDSGNNSYVVAATDLDGDPRIMEGDFDGIAEVDMGADEYIPVADWYVDGDVASSGDGRSWAAAFKTIQEAIDAIKAIDWFEQKWRYEIWIKKGTYYITSTIDLDVANIKAWTGIYGGFTGTETQRSQRDWRVNATTVDAQGLVQCFRVDGIAFTIDGVAIKNGYAWYSGGIGVFDYAMVWVANCTFSGHDGDEGGAVYCANSEVKIWNSLFSDNFAGDDREGGGGAIYTKQSELSVIGSVFMRNQAVDGADGGAIHNDNSSAGIYNCTFLGNSVPTGAGGAVYNRDSSLTIANSILWNDSARDGGPEIYNQGTSTSAVHYSDIDQDGYAGTNHNIRQDPLFDGPDDFHLQSTSPCIDTGIYDIWPTLSTDIDGDERIVDGDGDGEADLDMGADEYMPISKSDIDGDGDADGKDLSIFAGAFGSVLGDSNYNPGADFNEDNAVDEDDLAIFALNFGKTN